MILINANLLYNNTIFIAFTGTSMNKVTKWGNGTVFCASNANDKNHLLDHCI